MPVTTGLEPIRLLMPAWCSMQTTFMPRSSQSRNSSITSSKSVAATFGSQRLFGSTARTECDASRIALSTKG